MPPDKRRAHLVSAWPSKRFQAYTEATSKLYIQGNQKANIYGLQLIPYPASSVALKGIEGRSFFFFFFLYAAQLSGQRFQKNYD